jgi:hypothetical protein
VLRDAQAWLIDEQLEASAPEGTAFAGRLVSPEDFAITCGVDLRAGSESEIDAAFASLAQLRTGALVIGADAFFANRREQLVALAARYAVPAIYQWREFTAAGGLISYGTNLIAVYRRVGVYAEKNLKGAKPADLPVEQPTTFELVVNLKKAQSLGLTIRPRSSPAPTRSSNETARAAAPSGWHNDGGARRRGAAEGDAGDRLPEQHLADTGRSGLGRIPARLGRNRLRRGTKRGD